jgi:hypothetical protein
MRMLPASALHIYAAAMEEAAGALMRAQWELHGGPPRREGVSTRNPHAKAGWIVAVIKGDRA